MDHVQGKNQTDTEGPVATEEQQFFCAYVTNEVLSLLRAFLVPMITLKTMSMYGPRSYCSRHPKCTRPKSRLAQTVLNVSKSSALPSLQNSLTSSRMSCVSAPCRNASRLVCLAAKKGNVSQKNIQGNKLPSGFRAVEERLGGIPRP